MAHSGVHQQWRGDYLRNSFPIDVFYSIYSDGSILSQLNLMVITISSWVFLYFALMLFVAVFYNSYLSICSFFVCL